MSRELYRELEKGIDVSWIRRVLQEMILIRSENPFHDPPETGFREKEMADYLSDQMSSLGLKVEQREVIP